MLESAIAEAFADGAVPHFCEEIDLCDERSYRVMDFFGSLRKGKLRNARDLEDQPHVVTSYKKMLLKAKTREKISPFT